MDLTNDQFDDILDHVYVSKLLAYDSSENICAAYIATSFEVYSQYYYQWQRKPIRTGDYSNHHDAFVWRNITFLWKGRKIRGASKPPSSPMIITQVIHKKI